MTPRVSPTRTSWPSPFSMLLRVPLCSAPISKFALLVSSSSSGSPVWTGSPTFLYQCTTVASTMDSPMLGTRILMSISLFLQAALQNCMHLFFLCFPVRFVDPCWPRLEHLPDQLFLVLG